MLTIDRFEGDFAVCQKEDGAMINIKKALLPADCIEGDALEAQEGVYVKKDNPRRREHMKSKMQALFGKSTKG